MEKELPKGWCKVKIEDISIVVGGGTPNSNIKEYFEGGIIWVTPADLSGYKKMYISNGRRNLSSDGLKNSSAKVLPKNSVLFSSRAPIGYVAIAGSELATNQGFKSILPSPVYHSHFAYYYLKSIKDFAESQASGTTFKELSGKKFGELPFPLPPINEQKRIAEKLDAIFGHLDILKARLDEIPKLLKQFRQQVLTQAVTGKLTEDWRKGRLDINSNLTWQSGVITDFYDLNPGHKGLNIPNDLEVSFIPMSAVGEENGLINTSNIRKYQEIKNGYTKFIENDVLFAKITPCMENGKIAIAQKLKNRIGCGSTEFHVLRSKQRIHSDFLFLFFLQDSIRDSAKRNFHGTSGHLRVPSSFFQETTIDFPPDNEQAEIVRRVEELFTFADQIEEKYQLLKSEMDKLPQSILAKAFRGELVPQDPADEPASELLKRIRQEKDAGKKIEKRKKILGHAT